jgi:hypothetical protein
MSMFRSWPSILAVTAMLTLGALVYWFGIRSPHPTAEAALEEFYRGESRPECLITQPLEQHGPDVVPLVIRDLPNKTMPRRRYAIGFLGEGQYREALPALEHIWSDTAEIYYFRADALIAIFKITPARAQELASRVVLPPPDQDRYGLLQRAVKAVERGDMRGFVYRGCG